MEHLPPRSSSRSPTAWPSWAQYALSLGAVALVLFLQAALYPRPGGNPPFAMLAGVLLVLVFAVRWAQFLAGGLAGWAGVWLIFMPPRFSFRVAEPIDSLYLAVFGVGVLGAALASFIADRRRKMGQQARAALHTTLGSIGDAVITTDTKARITYLNKVAEQVTGWPLAVAAGAPLGDVFRIVNEETRAAVESPVDKVFETGQIVGLANHTILIRKDGEEVPIDDSAAAIRDEHGVFQGVVLVFRDISERRKAENALRRSEQELSDFFENATVGLQWVGPEGTILRVNQTELDMLGYSREELIGRNIADFFVDPGAMAEVFARLERGEIVRDQLVPMRRKDGAVREVMLSSNVLFEGGKFVHCRCITRDVTDLNRAQRAQAALAAIVESSDDAIVGKSLDGTIKSWNKAAERIFGYSAAEAVGRHITFIFPPERVAEEEEILSRIRAGQRVDHFETVRVRKDGRRIGISLTVSPVKDDTGRIIGASKIARDISGRMRQEQARLESEERLRLALEAGQMGTWEWSVPSNKLVWSPTLEAIHGLEPGSFAGTIDAYWRVVHPDDRERVENRLRQLLESGPGHHLEYRIVRPDGAVRWLEARGKLYRDEEGIPQRAIGVCADITPRKLAEDAVRQSEQRFRLMADAAPVMIWISGVDRRATWFNKQWLDFVGRPTERETGDGWAESIHPDDVDRCIQTYVQAFDKRERFTLEFRLRKHDGQYCWILAKGTPLYAENGFAGYIGSCFDITDRKQGEEALRESEERYRLVVAGSEAAIWDWDMLARRVVYSPRWKALRGLSEVEISDREEEWSSGIHPEDRERVMAALQAHLEGRTSFFSEEYRIRHKDGRWIWILDRGLAQRDGFGRVVRMAGSETDITARKHAEQALRESEERFRTLADSAPALIWLNGPNGCEFVNRAYLDFVGVESEDVRNYDWARFLHPAERERVLDSYHAAAAERSVYEQQHRFRRADGKYRWMKSVGLPRFGADGQFRGFVGSSFDITDVKQAENFLREVDRRKDEFLAVLGHELRNPLAAISTGTALLQSNPAPERRVWIEQMITRQTAQLRRLVDDLLDVSRISRGKIELRREPVSVRKVLESSAAAAEELISQRGHRLEVSAPPEDIWINADPARLEQIVSNLLANAAKYTPDGGSIRLSAERRENEALIRCRDNGQGLSADLLESIFEPFVQANNTSEGDSPGGLGVGLTLARKLAELHGGSISVASEGPGKGSEFLLRLPALADQPESSPASEQAARKQAHARSRRVLVVDDNEDLAESIAVFLRDAGHEVAVAHDGLEAIRLAGEQPPEIVLLDIGLPGMDGYAVAERLRELPKLKHSKIIAISGYKVSEDDRRTRARFDLRLTKPVVHEQLVELLGATREGDKG